MPVLSFISDDDVAAFAQEFLNNRRETFSKDIDISLTIKNNSHAYFPALITCIAFADLLSGLYAGKLDGHGLNELKNYVSKFMNTDDYDSDRLDILYECFRHKVAHLAQPYVVFDTHSKERFRNQPRRLITWEVTEVAQTPAIEIVAEKNQIERAPTPWPVFYDYRVTLSVPTLAQDIEESIQKYLDHLRKDQVGRDRFKNCMNHYFPR